ncbi:MAG TPA: MazG family protein [Nocardioidaceae bacterium]|nr:MazG family protein [Nocardioidaceae bacterium]
MSLTFLVTSPRVAPGLMSWAAWQAVASADRVLASDAQAPGVRAVTSSGHQVDVLPGATADDLLAAAATDDVVWLASDEEATAFPVVLAERIVTAEEAPEIEVLHGSYDVPGARLLDLVTVMDRLRTSCPWDREQTHRSLARYLLEETYETLEAMETGDYTHLREELGDLLLQVYFHARIAAEDPDDPFTIDDVAGGIVDKLVHRHPHVFARSEESDAPSLDEVNRSWETLKAAEKGRGSVLDGIPLALPALSLAEKTLGRAARVGVEPASGTSLGDRLLGLVVEARAAGLDAEQQLREAVRRLADVVRDAETA